MLLLNQVAQCRTPFIVASTATGQRTHLSGAMELAGDVRQCPIRYVLSDDLTGLCTDLAHSSGTRVYGCMDLLRVPATRLWIEWCYDPWITALRHHGFGGMSALSATGGRFGVLISASETGECGTMRAFWSAGPDDTDVYASSVESPFNLNGGLDADALGRSVCLRVTDVLRDVDDKFARSFHFVFERSWEEYYLASLGGGDRYVRVLHDSAAPLALAVPFLLAFFLLLQSRDGLPREPRHLERLNATRLRKGKAPLLDHVEVRSPLFAAPRATSEAAATQGLRLGPRLHHVRGHLVRRANRIFWRVPHLRGSAMRGIIRSRTVTWTMNVQHSQRATPLEMMNTRPE